MRLVEVEETGYAEEVKSLHIRFPPSLRKRVQLAAASGGVNFPTYCRKHLESWVREGMRVPEEGKEGRVEGSPSKIPIGDGMWKEVRKAAIFGELTTNDLVIRVLELRTPHALDLLIEETSK